MVADVMEQGVRGGWRVIDASALAHDQALETDIVIVGSGAGGGVCAEILARAGLRVVLVEEGPLKTGADFRMREAEAYPELYQESAGRKTRDKAINILQGRCVGGGTTVNWTASFRAPAATLSYWRERLGLSEFTAAALAPWYAMAERRVAVARWQMAPNRNNAVLAQGAAALKLRAGAIPRNVHRCANLGYCGLGCPTGAKQSMLVTTIPAALAAGAILYTRLRAQRLVCTADRVEALECVAMDARGIRPLSHRLRIRARHYIVAAGAIGTPALLLRSDAPDPHGLLGRRTFLHPTLVSIARMPERVEAYAGAPQSVYLDHYLEQEPIDGPIGFKLETPPVHPVLAATTLQGFGAEHAQLMRDFAYAQVLIALLRDGFHPDSPGGTVQLRDDGTPVLDYRLTPALWDGARRAWLAMAEIQFAAGAREVSPVHEQARPYRSWREAQQQIAALELKPHAARVVSAHVMGGCAMAARPHSGVVDVWGGHFQLSNVSVVDGSVFPTSLGTNPQLFIYALAARNASRLAERFTGRPAPALGKAG
jgi:choline dehydrogenase-like flavoprotein